MKSEKFLDLTILPIIILFAYTGLSKLLNYQEFVVAIHKSYILKNIPGSIAWIVPFLEIVFAVLLVTPNYKKIGIYGAFVLMFFFTLYVVIILSSSKNLPCSCGGIFQHLNWDTHLYINMFFLGLTIISLLLIKHKPENSCQINF